MNALATQRPTHLQWLDCEQNAEDFAEHIDGIVDAVLTRLPEDQRLIFLDKLVGLAHAWSGEHQSIVQGQQFTPLRIQLDGSHDPRCECGECAEGQAF